MLTHAIVELEEGALTATVAAREGRTTKVLRSVRVPLPDLGRDGLIKAAQGFTAVSEVLRATQDVEEETP